MPDFTDEEIANEAHRIWEAAGRPLWGNAHDHWQQAIANLRLTKEHHVSDSATAATGRDDDSEDEQSASAAAGEAMTPEEIAKQI